MNKENREIFESYVSSLINEMGFFRRRPKKPTPPVAGSPQIRIDATNLNALKIQLDEYIAKVFSQQIKYADANIGARLKFDLDEFYKKFSNPIIDSWSGEDKFIIQSALGDYKNFASRLLDFASDSSQQSAFTWRNAFITTKQKALQSIDQIDGVYSKLGSTERISPIVLDNIKANINAYKKMLADIEPSFMERVGAKAGKIPYLKRVWSILLHGCMLLLLLLVALFVFGGEWVQQKFKQLLDSIIEVVYYYVKTIAQGIAGTVASTIKGVAVGAKPVIVTSYDQIAGEIKKLYTGAEYLLPDTFVEYYNKYFKGYDPKHPTTQKKKHTLEQIIENGKVVGAMLIFEEKIDGEVKQRVYYSYDEPRQDQAIK